MSEKLAEGYVGPGPTLDELDCLQRILHRAKHRQVADRMLAAFLWSTWPEWYDYFYEETKRQKFTPSLTTEREQG